MSAPRRILRKIMEEWLLSIATLLLIITSIYLRRIPSYDWSDLDVLYMLFVFLITVRGMEESGFLQKVSARLSGRNAGVKMVLFTALLSVFVTNDIALLVMVPLTLSSGVKNKGTAVIMETLSVNALSSISPIGNPQNIFIFYHYGLSPMQFIRAIAPFSLVSTAIILLASYILLKGDGGVPLDERYEENGMKGWTYALFFIMFLAAMFDIIPLWTGLIVPIYALIYDRRSLRIDYLLLLTFFVFFGLSDNLYHILMVRMSSSGNVFLYSAIGSQFISNVPSALLFSDFTGNWRALLWGVSVGGFGTLVASMANLISYRFYRRSSERDFLLRFHIWSFPIFVLGILLFFFMDII